MWGHYSCDMLSTNEIWKRFSQLFVKMYLEVTEASKMKVSMYEYRLIYEYESKMNVSVYPPTYKYIHTAVDSD